MHGQQILGSGIILGTILVLSLVAAGVIQNRASAQGSGIGLLWTDVALLIVYAFAGMILWKQTFPSAITAAMVGAQIGLAVGAVQIANHLIEAFVPTRPFVLVISPVLLTFALLGTAGAAARQASPAPDPGRRSAARIAGAGRRWRRPSPPGGGLRMPAGDICRSPARNARP